MNYASVGEMLWDGQIGLETYETQDNYVRWNPSPQGEDVETCGVELLDTPYIIGAGGSLISVTFPESHERGK